MGKPTLKRLGLGIIQQMLAAFISIAIAGVLFNSYLSVNSMQGTKTYFLEPLSTEPEFEDSDLFRDIFQTAVSDVMRLVVIKEQVETNGEFDSHKKIDVTKFANRKGTGNGCSVTAVYELEDLIKWGKYGVEYTNRVMSMSQFINYFGPATAPGNFALNEDGQLYFAGFFSEGEDTVYNLPMEKGREALTDVEEAMLVCSTEQLEDMAFSYIMAKNLDEIRVSREDDGSLTVYVRMLNCRYETDDGERQLTSHAGNWIDYVRLQQNVAESIITLTENYQQYQNCHELYEEGEGNLKYVVRMMTKEGMRTYTNVPELEGIEESEITDYFGEFRRYLIYYPDSLVFMGNTSLTESDIYAYLSEYEYAYPDTSHIWIGVDTSYSVTGDAFYHANSIFQKIVPNIGLILSIIVILAVLWLGIGVYLTLTAGTAYNEEGEEIPYLSGIDHVWTELMLLLAVGLAYAAFYISRWLLSVADLVYLNYADASGSEVSRIYEYGLFGIYGFLISMFFNLVWYSFVRRLKCRTLWRDSFLHWLLVSLGKVVNFVFRHKNMMVSTMIPYNLFLLVNVAGIFTVIEIQKREPLLILVVIGLVLFDGLIGMILFKKNAEQVDIVEGIKRIRDGEVDYKLECESLHGANREMADAVNNIGEGIRNAVRTSMKDEQMKTDLITNVSHDIKTPLTSIINYVDLLKRLRMEDEPAKSYIDILDNKAQRLKQLTDDLVEASKISSGNIELKKEKINLAELLNQTVGEMADKLEEQGLQVVFEGGDLEAYIFADSRRMWRVIENLFNNICKYALENTRVYVDLSMDDTKVEAAIKNISKRQMNVRGDELTERFIRGDSARTTEGSGLGLYIAKSLTQVQGGSFSIHLDGDLFKVVLSFEQYAGEENLQLENAGTKQEKEGL